MNKSIRGGLVALAFTGIFMLALPISAQTGNSDNSDYSVLNKTTGVCITVTRWPGGDVGLARLQAEYPAPTWTVTLGYSCDEYVL